MMLNNFTRSSAHLSKSLKECLRAFRQATGVDPTVNRSASPSKPKQQENSKLVTLCRRNMTRVHAEVAYPSMKSAAIFSADDIDVYCCCRIIDPRLMGLLGSVDSIFPSTSSSSLSSLDSSPGPKPRCSGSGTNCTAKFELEESGLSAIPFARSRLDASAVPITWRLDTSLISPFSQTPSILAPSD